MKKQSDRIARATHWVFALFVINMLCIGFYMTNTPYDLSIYQWHKSLGVIFLGLVWIRLYLSIKHPWQSSTAGTGKATVVKTAHIILLALMVTMPITGILSSGFSGFSVHLFDLIIIPENRDAAGNIVPFNATAYQTAKWLHRIIAYALAALVCLHILAALKHHFVNRDNTLRRMLFGQDMKN